MVPHDPKKDDPQSKKFRDWLSVSNLIATVTRIIVELIVR